MTVPRDSPYMYATWPTRYITGDKSCQWACWYKTHYYKYRKEPSDFDLVRWQAEHTVLMDSLTNELEQKGCTVRIEHQNSLQYGEKSPALEVESGSDVADDLGVRVSCSHESDLPSRSADCFLDETRQ